MSSASQTFADLAFSVFFPKPHLDASSVTKWLTDREERACILQGSTVQFVIAADHASTVRLDEPLTWTATAILLPDAEEAKEMVCGQWQGTITDTENYVWALGEMKMDTPLLEEVAEKVLLHLQVVIHCQVKEAIQKTTNGPIWVDERQLLANRLIGHLAELTSEVEGKEYTFVPRYVDYPVTPAVKMKKQVARDIPMVPPLLATISTRQLPNQHLVLIHLANNTAVQADFTLDALTVTMPRGEVLPLPDTQPTFPIQLDPFAQWTFAYVIASMTPLPSLAGEETASWYALEVHAVGKSAMAGDRNESIQVAWSCEVKDTPLVEPKQNTTVTFRLPEDVVVHRPFHVEVTIHNTSSDTRAFTLTTPEMSRAPQTAAYFMPPSGTTMDRTTFLKLYERSTALHTSPLNVLEHHVPLGPVLPGQSVSKRFQCIASQPGRHAMRDMSLSDGNKEVAIAAPFDVLVSASQ